MSMGPIKFLTIHCTATPEGRHHTAAEVSAWDVAKFGQISYHDVCELDGKIVRTLAYNKRGAHVGGHNTGNLGFCYVGGMDKAMKQPKDTRTDAQKAAMIEYIRLKERQFPGIIIRGHNEWLGVKKACPSFSVRQWLREVGLR